MVLSLNTMPNSSEDAIWEQIQTNLDRLNSNYENGSKILAHIQATCTKICATLRNHQRFQQSPICQIQAKSTSAFPPLNNDSTALEANNSTLTALQFQNLASDYEKAALENAATNFPEFTMTPVHTKVEEEAEESDFCFLVQPQQQQAKSTENPDQAIIQQSSLSICNYKAITQFQQQQRNSFLNSNIIDAEKEAEASDLANEEQSDFKFDFQPEQQQESTAISDQARFPNSIPIPLILEHTEAEGVNRPQPKPLYAFPDAAVGLAPTTSTGEAAVLLRGSGAEDGAIAKGERTLAKAGIDGAATMDDDDVTNLNNRCGTSTTETRGAQAAPNLSTVSHDAASATGSRESGRSGRDRKVPGFRRVSPIGANPPTLLVAVFPWDRGEEAIAMAGSGEGTWKAVPVPPCKQRTADSKETGAGRQCRLLHASSRRSVAAGGTRGRRRVHLRDKETTTRFSSSMRMRKRC
ncbi:uncharacterized protein DS421_19g671520 [Arachis hypogaea]|uniref:Uncharacterized protein n=1 Tax=Arachis hypogaea TaxID=3818 RepID=A0A6B9VG96_ARAHY|nr:uncharacterized protein DS421_19g671520 [Arachis hypogaea]